MSYLVYQKKKQLKTCNTGPSICNTVDSMTQRIQLMQFWQNSDNSSCQVTAMTPSIVHKNRLFCCQGITGLYTRHTPMLSSLDPSTYSSTRFNVNTHKKIYTIAAAISFWITAAAIMLKTVSCLKSILPLQSEAASAPTLRRAQ